MKYREGYKYWLTESETFVTDVKPNYDIDTNFINLLRTGELTLRAGYAWDGATGAFDTDTNLAASAVHDAFCQLIQLKLLSVTWKTQADIEYYKLCRQYGMFLPRAITHFATIEHHRWDTRPYKPVLEVLPKYPRVTEGEAK